MVATVPSVPDLSPRARSAGGGELEAVEPVEDDVGVAEEAGGLEALGQLGVVEVDLAVASEEVAQVAPSLPRVHGVALDDAVGVVAGHPPLDEGQQDGLGVHEATCGFEVLEHAPGVELEAGDEAGHAGEGEVEEEAGIGQRHPLDRGVRDVPLVPEGDVLEPGAGVAAEETGEARDVL